MRSKLHIFIFLLSCVACSGSSGSENESSIAGDRSLQGGDTTADNRTSQAFETPSSNLDQEAFDFHLEGDVAFEATFVTPPAPVNPGLGPVFNNSSCAGCHFRNGRGGPVFGTGSLGSQALVRLSLDSGISEFPGAPPVVPGLGNQLQDHAVFGVPPEGSVAVRYEIVRGSYADGEEYTLRRPLYDIRLADGTPLGSDVRFSVRVAPPVFGLGLLEAVPDEAILAQADPEDLDGDGISGRANMVWDALARRTVLGRFGWKASQPNLLQQSAAAYIEDMGVHNPVFPAEDGSAEIDTDVLQAAEFYVQTLAVPEAVNLDDSQVERGEALFLSAGCARCHTPRQTSGEHPVASVSNQEFFPYTDLLLHDMGRGLADNRPDFLANGQEWRTTPLWGLGVTRTVSGSRTTFLHDGRAQSIAEAILWHGGEAQSSRDRFRRMSKGNREALIAFLNSL